MALRPCDISLPTSSTPGSVRLDKTKRGRNQSVLFDDPVLTHFMTSLLRHTPEDQPFFTFSLYRFQTTMDAAHRDLGVDFRVTSHSLRHGGATHEYLNGVPFEDIRVRGRWKSAASCENYIQASRTLMLAVRLSPSHLDRAAALASRSDDFKDAWSAGYGMEVVEGALPSWEESSNPNPPSATPVSLVRVGVENSDLGDGNGYSPNVPSRQQGHRRQTTRSANGN